MKTKIINANVKPDGGEFIIEYQGDDGEGREAFSGTLAEAIAHGVAGADAAVERVSVWGTETINGTEYRKVGAMAFAE